MVYDLSYQKVLVEKHDRYEDNNEISTLLSKIKSHYREIEAQLKIIHGIWDTCSNDLKTDLGDVLGFLYAILRRDIGLFDAAEQRLPSDNCPSPLEWSQGIKKYGRALQELLETSSTGTHEFRGRLEPLWHQVLRINDAKVVQPSETGASDSHNTSPLISQTTPEKRPSGNVSVKSARDFRGSEIASGSTESDASSDSLDVTLKNKGWNNMEEFMASYKLKPWKPDDVKEAIAILIALNDEDAKADLAEKIPVGSLDSPGLRKSEPSEPDDILLLKHKTTVHTLRFPAHSIEDGLVTVGDVRRRAAFVTWWGHEDHRVTLFYQNKRLRRNQNSCRDEGIKHHSEIMCVTNQLKRSGSSFDGSRKGVFDNELGPEALLSDDERIDEDSDVSTHSASRLIPGNPDKPHFISAQSLFELLQNCPSDGILLLDVRVSSEYQKSHIDKAINLCIPTTLLKRPSFNMQKLMESLTLATEKRKFSNWKSVQYIVIYDASCSLPADAAYCMRIVKKFTNEGSKGTPAILRGGFVKFLKKYPHMTSSDLSDGTVGIAQSTLMSPSSTAAGNSSTSLSQIAAIQETMRAEYFPECTAFLDSPPRDPEAREAGLNRLREMLLDKVLTTLSSINTKGDSYANAKRKSLVQECRVMLDSLDLTRKYVIAGEDDQGLLHGTELPIHEVEPGIHTLCVFIQL